MRPTGRAGGLAILQTEVSTVKCAATDDSGRKYELAFESDGAPITLRRVRKSARTIRQDDPFR
jgi:hypothetical protein